MTGTVTASVSPFGEHEQVFALIAHDLVEVRHAAGRGPKGSAILSDVDNVQTALSGRSGRFDSRAASPGKVKVPVTLSSVRSAESSASPSLEDRGEAVALDLADKPLVDVEPVTDVGTHVLLRRFRKWISDDGDEDLVFVVSIPQRHRTDKLARNGRCVGRCLNGCRAAVGAGQGADGESPREAERAASRPGHGNVGPHGVPSLSSHLFS